MAFSTTHIFDQILDAKSQRKRSDAALKHYSSADNRLWKNDKFQRSIGLQDVLTRESHHHNIDKEDLSREELLKEINELLQKIKQKDSELDEMHQLYKATSKKLKDVEVTSKQYEVQLKESKEMITRRLSEIQSRADEDDDKETKIKTLEDQLSKYASVEGLLKKLQQRAEEADQMEDEIVKLKRDLQNCGHGASGDKIKIAAIDQGSSSIETHQHQQCQKCMIFQNELIESKSMLEMEEKKNVEVEAERNFLKHRLRKIEILEAELILYKTKYEECECIVLHLKEMLIKAEQNERHLKESREELKVTLAHLHESEKQNQSLISYVEQLDMDLRERDIYIESINQRLSREVVCTDVASKTTANFEEITHGQVQTIVKKLSNEISPITCKCSIGNCKCALVANSSSVINENMIETIDLSSKSTFDSIERAAKIDDEGMREKAAGDQMNFLQLENDKCHREINRLNEELAEIRAITDEMDTHRASNSQLEREKNELLCMHEQEMDTLNSNYRALICQKSQELQALGQQLNVEVEKTNYLEQKILNMHEELNSLKKLRESYDKIDQCHSAQINELKNFKRECMKSHNENENLKCQIKCLKEKFEMYKCSVEQQTRLEIDREQRATLKKTAAEFKKHYDDKILMITCYEEKIRYLKAENDSLKCFRDKFLLGGKCRCCKASAKVPRRPINENVDYSKVIDEICARHQIKLEGESDGSKGKACSEISPSVKPRLKKKRSKSLEKNGFY